MSAAAYPLVSSFASIFLIVPSSPRTKTGACVPSGKCESLNQPAWINSGSLRIALRELISGWDAGCGLIAHRSRFAKLTTCPERDPFFFAGKTISLRSVSCFRSTAHSPAGASGTHSLPFESCVVPFCRVDSLHIHRISYWCSCTLKDKS